MTTAEGKKRIFLTGGSGFSGDPREFYMTNVQGTPALLDAAVEAKINTFIYIGAASVINGKPAKDVDESYLPDILPKDLYSETKYQAEKAVIKIEYPKDKDAHPPGSGDDPYTRYRSNSK